MKNDLVIPVTGSKMPSVSKGFKKLLLIDKLGSKLGITLLLLVMIAVGVAMGMFGFTFGVITLAIVIGIPLIYAIVAYPRLGIIVFLIMAYLIMWFLRMGVGIPLGTVMDGMEALFILGLFINQKKGKKDWSMFSSPVTFMVIVWLVYNIMEVLNPTTEARGAWIYTVRTVAIIMLMYFVFQYYINSKEYIRTIFKTWIALAIFGALYALKQEHVGFFNFEEIYLHSDPNIMSLLFIAGVWRKFSIFSDPVSFAYNMVTVSLLCIGIMTGPIEKKKKLVLGCLLVLFMIAMLSSGTRGAYVLMPASLMLLAVLKYNRTVMLLVVAGAIGFIGLIFMPTSNPTLYRFQSAFKPSTDASFNVRAINQKRIQPFIQAHPLGGGLGSTGVWGKKFAPNSYLANFPPDSGYVRVAVELGWLGLLIFCILMFVILRTGINNYYSIRDPELKSYCLASVLVIFALNIGNYPQEALVQFPSNALFYLSVAMIMITKRLDDQQNAPLHAR
jgi:putative inorganic carbon (HCO3(-)) transporter